jgi:hypothetical protein
MHVTETWKNTLSDMQDVMFGGLQGMTIITVFTFDNLELNHFVNDRI